MKEMKVILSKETIKDDKLCRLRVICDALHDKQKDLDKLILSLCLNENIEQDINKAEEISRGKMMRSLSLNTI